MPKKPKITPEEWAVRKAASAVKAAKRARWHTKVFRNSLSADERVVYDAQKGAVCAARLKARNKARATARRLASKPRDPAEIARTKEAQKLWKQNNREHTKQWKREYYRKNLTKMRAARSEYARTHSKQRNEAKKRRLKDSPEYRILYNLRDRLKELLEPATCRTTRISSLTGCTRQELRSHLESKFLPGMGWHNYGTAWHVDRIKPCASFDLTDAEAKQACFHYTNLQPLWDTINVEKSDSVTYDTAYALSQTPYPS